jgi:vitamin K-dependent gamma-carboxylase
MGAASFFSTIRRRAFERVDIASIVFFRIAFGSLIVWQVWKYFVQGTVATLWIEPRFLFKYYGFSWVHPWPPQMLYIHWAAVGIFAFFVAIGFCYRISTVLLWLCYTYFFLLDEARFVNHTYLICLFSFLLIFIPTHRAFSVDAWMRPGIRSQTILAWCLWLLRLQIGVVYFYAGLAKVAPDWLLGEPMRLRLSLQTDFPILGRFFREEWAVYAASYGALLLDLFVVPLLLWRRTRVPAFCLATLFHLMNARLFPIGIFPWLAIVATTLFFSPNWPRRLIALVRRSGDSSPPVSADITSERHRGLVLGFVTVYAAIQIFVPLRHFLTPGGIEWNYAEHRFSWRMMLIGHESRAFFYVTDPNTGKTAQVGLRQFLNARQRSMMSALPDFSVQFAHYLATVMPRRGPLPLRVEARILTGINGRRAQLYVDPNVDLAAESRPLLRPSWLREIHDPLPPRGQRYRETSFLEESGDNQVPSDP